MSNPLVSVVMTAYNREKYIEAAIASVLASTYKNFELIIVDDCSTDRTIEICQSFAARDPRIKLYLNEKNLGQFANRNLSATYASGEYIKYFDSDDLMYPTGLEVLVTMMEQFPEAGYGLCSIPQDDERIFPYVLSPEQAYRRHFIREMPIFHKAPLSSIIRTSTFRQSKGFTNPSAEGDYEYWMQLSTDHNVLLMPEGVVWYRVHAEQIDHLRKVNRLANFKYFLSPLKYFGDSCPLNANDKAYVIRRAYDGIVKYIILTALRAPGQAVALYRASGLSLGKFLSLSARAVFVKTRYRAG